MFCDSHVRGRGRLWTAALVGLFAIVASGCGGCDSEEPPERKQVAEKPEQTDAPKEEADKPAPRTEAFGLPFPPKVTKVEDRGKKVRVRTDTPLAEIQKFFETRLTDFEILTPGYEVRAVGLRDYMPEVYAYGVGSQTYVVYIPPKNKPAEAAKDGSEASKAPEKEPPSEPKYGEKVLDRTSDGRLLAPGARWGQPYTPPPGSPLHQERYRSNFGRPFGEWTLQ